MGQPVANQVKAPEAEHQARRSDFKNHKLQNHSKPFLTIGRENRTQPLTRPNPPTSPEEAPPQQHPNLSQMNLMKHQQCASCFPAPTKNKKARHYRQGQTKYEHAPHCVPQQSTGNPEKEETMPNGN